MARQTLFWGTVNASVHSVAHGTLIRGRREELGLTRMQLSLRLGWTPGQRSGWSPRTLVRIEAGERRLCDDGEVVLMARALELPEAQLRAALGLGDCPDSDADADDAEPHMANGTGPDDLHALMARLVAIQEESARLLREFARRLDRDLR